MSIRFGHLHTGLLRKLRERFYSAPYPVSHFTDLLYLGEKGPEMTDTDYEAFRMGISGRPKGSNQAVGILRLTNRKWSWTKELS